MSKGHPTDESNRGADIPIISLGNLVELTIYGL
jgi:hypothetical protein